MKDLVCTLKPLFENQNESFGIRELSRLTKINHTTVRQRLIKYEKQGLVEKKKTKLNFEYIASKNQKFKLLKKSYNIKTLHESGLLELLSREYDDPTMVLFGSYALAEDTKSSDIDICIISNIKKEINLKKYEKTLKKPIQLHLFSENKWRTLIKEKNQLINSIANGQVLEGHLVVV